MVIGGIEITGVEIGDMSSRPGPLTDGVEIGGVASPGTVPIGVVTSGVVIGGDRDRSGTVTAGVATLGTVALGTLTWGVVRLSMCVVAVGRRHHTRTGRRGRPRRGPDRSRGATGRRG